MARKELTSIEECATAAALHVFSSVCQAWALDKRRMSAEELFELAQDPANEVEVKVTFKIPALAFYGAMAQAEMISRAILKLHHNIAHEFVSDTGLRADYVEAMMEPFRKRDKGDLN